MNARDLLFLTAVACSFPSIEFGEGGVDATTDAGTSDAISIGDGGDAAPNPCDFDKDSYESLNCDGGDCDDKNPLVHPGADFSSADPTGVPLGGDWNCDFVVERKEPIVNCTLALTCAQIKEGFAYDAGCGKQAPWMGCEGLPALCTQADAGSRVQSCR